MEFPDSISSQTMVNQLLDFDPRPQPPGDRIEEAARAFHAENQYVFDALAAVCLEMREAGVERWSIKAAYEVVRYNGLVRRDGRTYKLNNNHTAHYARWLMERVPGLEGFFATREQGRIAQEYDE